MLAYFGRMISTAFPLISSSRLRPATTSPSPPALAAGAHSGATITTYTTHPTAGCRKSAALSDGQMPGEGGRAHNAGCTAPVTGHQRCPCSYPGRAVLQSPAPEKAAGIRSGAVGAEPVEHRAGELGRAGRVHIVPGRDGHQIAARDAGRRLRQPVLRDVARRA